MGCGVMRELGDVLTRCFTGTFLCRLKRRVGAVLGMEHLWTGDACCSLFLIEGCGLELVGELFFSSLTPCVFEQLGDGSNTDRLMPVTVSGLSSGVVSVALGQVRLFA